MGTGVGFKARAFGLAGLAAGGFGTFLAFSFSLLESPKFLLVSLSP
jgi:hypothetical protein